MPTAKRRPDREMSRELVVSLLLVCLAVQLLPLLQVSAEGSVESDFMALLNAERATLGKDSISVNTNLWTAAYLHSQDMAEQGYFSHTSLDGRTFDQRIIAAGYTNYSSLAENIAYAYGEPNAATVYHMWKNSTGHYANMMGDFDDAGLGVYSKNGYTYYTLDLGKSNTLHIPEFSSARMLFVFFPLAYALIFLARVRRRKQSKLTNDQRAIEKTQGPAERATLE